MGMSGGVNTTRKVTKHISRTQMDMSGGKNTMRKESPAKAILCRAREALSEISRTYFSFNMRLRYLMVPHWKNIPPVGVSAHDLSDASIPSSSKKLLRRLLPQRLLPGRWEYRNPTNARHSTPAQTRRLPCQYRARSRFSHPHRTAVVVQ